MSKPLIQVIDLVKTYDLGQTRALDGISLEIESGEFVAIQGPSGSGKSTLLNIISGLDRAESGEVCVAGQRLSRNGDLARFRARTVGFIFQLHNLIPSLTALENVMIPMIEIELSKKEALQRAKTLLARVSLTGKEHRMPTQLSGGERQRVAVARALANQPELILADEPTGSLDSQTEAKVLGLLGEIHQERNVTLIVVTHSPEVAQKADRIIQVRDGKIVEDKRV
ncbi:ABC transporter ATP-binding protein [Candidatus Acetothermia bacterium]|nr:ABC transporter ATP-binding protein [Candidatus Acetothermia bacterium]